MTENWRPSRRESPIFLVGASRSGTAMVRSGLNRHPDVFLAGETHYFDDLRPRIGGGQTPLQPGTSRELCEDYFLALAHRPFGHGGDPEQSRLARSELRALATELGGDGDAYFEAYCWQARQLEPDGAGTPARWGEKTPRHVFRLSEILVRYPAAQIVCMYRDPRAVVASYRDWRNQGGFDLDQDPGHRDALAEEQSRTSRSYDPNIASLLWRATARAGYAALASAGEDRVRVTRYEDIVADPERAFRELAAWLRLDFDPLMLEVPLHNSSVSAFEASAGVSSAPLERWRTTLPPRETAVVQRWCRTDMAALGYHPVSTGVSRAGEAAQVAKLPLALVRAVSANASRMGGVHRYLWRRVRLVVTRR